MSLKIKKINSDTWEYKDQEKGIIANIYKRDFRRRGEGKYRLVFKTRKNCLWRECDNITNFKRYTNKLIKLLDKEPNFEIGKDYQDLERTWMDVDLVYLTRWDCCTVRLAAA